MSLNLIQRILLILKVGSAPITFAYPIPLASFVAFSLSGSGVENFIISFVFCFFFFTAINLWNHLNDVEDDIKGGKNYAKVIVNNKQLTFTIVVTFYICSGLLTFFFAKDQTSLFFYFVCAFFTWIYSDKYIIGKTVKRLKEWYVTELLTYLIVAPLYTLVLWSFFSPISDKGIAFSLILTSFVISGMLLKDIKDISEDLSSGYRTLAVVFSANLLLKISISLNIAGNILILLLSTLKILPLLCGLSSVTAIIPLYIAWKLKQENWILSDCSASLIKFHPFSYLLSLSLLTFFSFISTL